MGAVRGARESDIPALLGLIESLFAIETDFIFDPAKVERALRLILARDDAQILVYEEDGAVLGTATLHTIISTAEGGPSGLIEDVAVARHAQGRGIGRALMAAAARVGRGRGMTRLQLLADKKNAPALKFYEADGWRALDLIARRKML